MSGTYLIWSHEHGAWWGPGEIGYLRRLSHAGHYTREQAIEICTEAIPGGARVTGALQELPIAFDDVAEMVRRYSERYPNLPRPERWE